MCRLDPEFQRKTCLELVQRLVMRVVDGEVEQTCQMRLKYMNIFYRKNREALAYIIEWLKLWKLLREVNAVCMFEQPAELTTKRNNIKPRKVTTSGMVNRLILQGEDLIRAQPAKFLINLLGSNMGRPILGSTQSGVRRNNTTVSRVRFVGCAVQILRLSWKAQVTNCLCAEETNASPFHF